MGVVYTLGSVAGSDVSQVTANASDVLSPKVIVDKNGHPLVGTMTNNGSWSGTTSYQGSLTIPKGYHDGTGKVTGGSFSFSGTAGTADVLNGKTFYSNSGTRQTGSMTNNGAWSSTTSYGGSVTIPAGYHNGAGTVTGGAFSFAGNAGTGDVLSGRTFYSNSGTRQTGTMEELTSWDSSHNGKVRAGGLWFDSNYPNGVSSLIYSTGKIVSGNSVVTWTNPADVLGNWTGVSDKNGNTIRATPTSSASSATFHYTGRIGGGNGQWREVFVYGWQWDPDLA